MDDATTSKRNQSHSTLDPVCSQKSPKYVNEVKTREYRLKAASPLSCPVGLCVSPPSTLTDSISDNIIKCLAVF